MRRPSSPRKAERLYLTGSKGARGEESLEYEKGANPAQHLAALKETVANLAATPLEQENYLRHIGTWPSLDELALEFDDAWRLLPGLVAAGFLDPALSAPMAELDRMLDVISGSENEPLWYDKALDGPEWLAIRKKANECLGLFPR